MQTQIFMSGNSAAVRIPKALWPIEPGSTVEIERRGDCIVITPVAESLSGVLDLLAEFDEGFMEGGREEDLDRERAW